MKAAWYERNGPARDVLTVGTMPDPVPGVGEVRVRMIASGVNPSDWKSRSGSRPMIAPRVIPHSDGAGVIDQVGPGAPSERLGQRVWVWNGQWNRAFGTAAEFIVLPAMQAAPLPSNVSFEEGACLGIPALTAYRAVTIDGSIKGQAVLVTGGAGAVGSYAIQFAQLLGAAKIFATVSSPEKAKHALASGADVAIDYKTEDVAARVKQLTGGDGVDRVRRSRRLGQREIVAEADKAGRRLRCLRFERRQDNLRFRADDHVGRGRAVFHRLRTRAGRARRRDRSADALAGERRVVAQDRAKFSSRANRRRSRGGRGRRLHRKRCRQHRLTLPDRLDL